ncbi:unnamed protein product [Arctogadus glacialis]
MDNTQTKTEMETDSSRPCLRHVSSDDDNGADTSALSRRSPQRLLTQAPATLGGPLASGQTGAPLAAHLLG